VKPMGRLFSFDEGAYKVVMSVFGRRTGARIRGLRVAALAATSTRSLPAGMLL